MFDHVKFGVSDYEASKAFFLKALAPLGVYKGGEGEPGFGVKLCQPGSEVSLCLHQTNQKPAPLHLDFSARSCQQVDAFHRKALAAGSLANGAPGLRPHDHADDDATLVIGPDGHKLEAVFHEREAR